MKKYLLAATMGAAMISTPALADGRNTSTDVETFTLRANNPAKCNLEATTQRLRISNNSISNNNGRARRNLANVVAREMNSAGVRAWCTGSSNAVNMYRTPFTIGTGDQTTDEFNQAVIYDVNMSIDGAVRDDGFTSSLEGTSDGLIGPGVGNGIKVSRFGPSGRGARVSFEGDGTSNAVSDGSDGTAARNQFTPDNNRLVAGRYSSELTIEITPAV